MFRIIVSGLLCAATAALTSGVSARDSRKLSLDGPWILCTSSTPGAGSCVVAQSSGVACSFRNGVPIPPSGRPVTPHRIATMLLIAKA